jgi:hypothetical protein
LCCLELYRRIDRFRWFHGGGLDGVRRIFCFRKKAEFKHPTVLFVFRQFVIHNAREDHISTTVRCAHIQFMRLYWSEKISELFYLHHKIIGFYNRDEVFTARYGLGL